MAHAHPSKDTCLDNSWDHQELSEVIHNNAFGNYYIYWKKFSLQHHFESASTNMNVTDYWPMAREYSVWNATVAASQFWTADLKAYVLSSSIEKVFSVFFYSTYTTYYTSNLMKFYSVALYHPQCSISE